MKKILGLALILASSLAFVSCSDRELPVDVEEPSGLYYFFGFTSEALNNNVMEDFPVREILIYAPPGYDTYDHRTRYPVLYLLHGFGGDHNYYRGLYGLAETMDELINSGEIEPMIVVVPNASNNLGGGFYTNSPDTLSGYPGQSFGGFYQDFICNEVVDSIDANYKTIPLREFRGIAGHSMGGYGAIKLAMLRNDLFGSVSSMSGPLGFNAQLGNVPGFHGILTLIPGVFDENGIEEGDTAGYFAIMPGTQKILTNMFFAMAAAFSPHDPDNPDTSLAHKLFPGRQYKVDLPFDAEGEVDETIWPLWLANDVSTLFLSAYSGVFDSTDLYVDAGNQDDFFFQLQSQYFAAAAGEYDAIDFFEIYSGSGNNLEPDHMTLINERLRQVIEFHDESFQPEFEQ
jgi:S-formylglutathione hydrolase FrmB